MEVGVRLVHGLDLLPAHRERLVMRTCEFLPGAQLSEYGANVLEGAPHPFQFVVREALADQRRAHLMVRDERAVRTLSAFVQLDLEVFDGGCLELFGDASLDVARRLPDFEKTVVRLVGYRVGVDARPSL